MFDVLNQMKIKHLENGILQSRIEFMFFKIYIEKCVFFSVIEQVKYLGLVANIEVRKAGFVYRREFAKFLTR
jgi:hypothetical protein